MEIFVIINTIGSHFELIIPNPKNNTFLVSFHNEQEVLDIVVDNEPQFEITSINTLIF